ncbi:hypothetical protein ACQR1I_30725 [Bradyrhizobium sp. HKCCYLS2038]|uniref:hypothetical protein n=1 Tax=unclassified Bradyrhizobium TaxID=2631580 RepID=UPI003EB718EF
MSATSTIGRKACSRCRIDARQMNGTVVPERAPGVEVTESTVRTFGRAVVDQEQARRGSRAVRDCGISAPWSKKRESKSGQLQALIDHFRKCAKFEQSLPKRMTNAKRSSTNSGLRLTLAEVWWSKSREEPWRATSSVTPLNKIKSELAGYLKGRHNFRAGPAALLYFFEQFLGSQRVRADGTGLRMNAT